MSTVTHLMPLTKGRPWCEGEFEILHEFYPDLPTQVIADALHRDVGAVYRKANSMGLKKSPAFLASEVAGRLDGVRGTSTRFQKGLTPWNKGIHHVAGGRSAETRFKPGSKPQTWRPVGSERLTKEGYLQRKVTDTGYTPRDWVGVHILLWSEHHGAVPAGHAVAFKDGNKTNIVIENLELVSRRELMLRNTLHNRYPKEVTLAIQLVGALNRKINAKHRRTA